MTRSRRPTGLPLLTALALTALALLGTVLLLPVTAEARAQAPARDAHARTSGTPVLGSPSLFAPYGEGWGTVRPREIYNGGDPAGDASRITWSRWGRERAIGHGVIPIFRPGGGYYRRPGRIVLRAEALGTCPDGTRGYTRLEFRVARRPDGPVGRHWHPWASLDGDICTSS